MRMIGVAVERAACSVEKIRRALSSSATISPSISTSGSALPSSRRRKLLGPQSGLAGERGLTVLDAQLRPVASNLLVAPALPARRTIDTGAELRRNEIGQRADLLLWTVLSGRAAATGRLSSARASAAITPVRIPDRASPDATGLRHQNAAAFAFAFGNLLHRPSRRTDSSASRSCWRRPP